MADYEVSAPIIQQINQIAQESHELYLAGENLTPLPADQVSVTREERVKALGDQIDARLDELVLPRQIQEKRANPALQRGGSGIYNDLMYNPDGLDTPMLIALTKPDSYASAFTEEQRHWVRAGAASALAFREPEQAIPALVTLLQDKTDGLAREAALSSLHHFGHKARNCLDLLMSIATNQSEDPNIRTSAEVVVRSLDYDAGQVVGQINSGKWANVLEAVGARSEIQNSTPPLSVRTDEPSNPLGLVQKMKIYLLGALNWLQQKLEAGQG